MPTAVVFHGVVGGESSEDRIHLESDRRRFVGRLGRWGQPAGLDEMEVAAEESHRSVLDPIMAVQAVVDLDARRTIELAFITAVSGSRSKTLELARSHASVQTLHWMFQDAEREMMKHLEFLGIEPGMIEVTERLLDAMFWPRSVLRAPDDRAGMALARQPRLWGQGVSGDYPILLLSVHDAESALIADTLAAHRYWNSCGIKVELVIINEMSSSYRDSIGDRIRRLLAQTRSALLLGQRGGLFLLPGDRLPALDRQNLFAAASAVLDTRAGDLSAQVDRVDDRLIALPALPATLPPSSIEPPEDEAVDLLFFNGLGGFTHDGSEYELRQSKAVRTPMPWCNVIANAGFGTVLSESGLGYSWANNSSEFRLTPWYNDPVQDPPGEVVYLRDEETAEVWSATPLPSSLDEDFSVKHGAGCTEYSHSSHGLYHKMRVFVPADASTKIIGMLLVNRLDRPRRLTITYFVEWVLGTVREQTRRFIRTDYAHDDGTLLAQCSWNPDFAGRHAFVTTDHEVHGFTCDRREFLGVDEDRSRPEGLKRWGLSSEIRQGDDACAAIQIHIDMDPGAQVDMHFVLGEAATREGALALARRMRDPRTIRSALLELQEQWEDRLGRLTVKTPDPALDLMINRWLPYQTISSRLFGRTGFYQSSGAFGFRDQLQDVMSLLQTQPSMARAHILDCAAHQFEEGDVMHWWHPPSDKGVRTRCSDDLLWLPYVTAHYVHGTGDDSILSEVVPFLRAEPLGPDMHVHYGQFDKGRSASVLEHCLAAIRRGFTQGEHGLPLMGDSDWNDGMDRVGSQGRGESVWLGWFLHATVTNFAQLLPARDREEWTGRCTMLRESLELHGWDGAWYRRAFHDDESIVGSARSVECQIDSISQSWATLSGAARKDRAIQALRSAYDHLVDEQQRIIYLLTPPFDRTRHDPGYIRAYPPGVRENGGQYTHAAAWLAWAFADAGDGDTAGHMLEMLNPIQHARDRSAVESYCVEPYALAADIYSVQPHDGRGGWTWYTGAASWTWRLGVEAVLGLRLEGGDLVIDPCLPSSWPGYQATLRHPDGEFDVVVENPDHVCRGRISVRLDGRLHATNRLPREAGRHEVHVTMHAIGDGSGSTASPREQSEGAATRPD